MTLELAIERISAYITYIESLGDTMTDDERLDLQAFQFIIKYLKGV